MVDIHISNGAFVQKGTVSDDALLRQRIFRARMRARATQGLIIAIMLCLFFGFLDLIWRGLQSHGISFSLSFLSQQAGFDISEGLTFVRSQFGYVLQPFQSQDTNVQALLAGLYNTLVVAAISIVLSTLLGVIVGVGRLSANWILNKWALTFVEVIRNTPLLIQILFWYFAVFLQFPRLAEAMRLGDIAILSQQGIYVPALTFSGSATQIASFGLLTLVVVVGAWLLRQKMPKGVLVAGTLAIVVGSFWALGNRIGLSLPQAGTFSVSGGIGLSPEMASLITGLSINTAAFIAEIVRGAIQSVPKGQWEAAASVGLGQSESLWVIVLPQAFRVILPSFGNQYVSLAKSTTFAIAIGFPDLFNVYGTVANQSGRSLEGILLIMVVYFLISVSISALSNFYNRRIIKKGGR